ncbi:MAG: lactamase [Candidatus Portnoybacteria bacterium CG_4_8_14_3_um_filter_44_10]|uniref:Lactamase n=3 Tax=Candidatus Portnoyibacteriota TaxID=1817913 RepID=A0A2H0KQ76_9BACT|nr:MAG: lactamase [Candidatus Portnoybacteria bacterium CG11_big_fil_rev_8_21_14_0_20_44_10]PIW75244.1 MAG: lactamase [Candidatus Portnoybacteria bacterium CG_4_8_14_3_um_filter_44_10]PIZ71782.1 MAG: lactamase [Candidatus Portnoybacteria bacterium CG_4_10_14_0_2_um_filter_44_20]
MVINWYGQSCFKIIANALTIVTDPFAKNIGLRPPAFAADIVCVSHQHEDHNNISAIGGEPFIVDGPGEYEIKGISILGVESFHDQKQGQERGLNTIYLIESEEIRLCHLGDFGQEKLSDEQLEALGGVDILFVPVGGKTTIDASTAAALVNQLEPKLVVPMHYKLPDLKVELDSADKFLKELGAPSKELVDKITVKKKLLPESTEVVMMKP